MALESITLALIAAGAAVVNGALGYGFSSITVPLALLFYTSRVLNPALVLVEVVVNGHLLFVNRRRVPIVWARVVPILAGLVPGIVAGAFLLSVVEPGWLKLAVFAVLLPLILLQAAGVRRPVAAERAAGVPFGASVGVLYAVTTISGPPLAVALNNQGLAKEEFRAALGLIRLAESVLTAIAYLALGLYTAPSGRLLYSIVPAVAIGIPLGAALVSRLDAETFRRVCMSFDAWVVGFGLSKTLAGLVPATDPLAYGIWLLVALVDGALLRSFFARRRERPSVGERAVIRRPTGLKEAASGS